jgi:hypothetical protein
VSFQGFLLQPNGLFKDLMEETCTIDPYICEDVIEFLCGKHRFARGGSINRGYDVDIVQIRGSK